MPTFAFHKLIRDKLPTMYAELNQRTVSRKLNGVEWLQALRTKLIEEAAEIPLEADNKEEIVGEISAVEQVLRDLKAALGISDQEVEAARLQKFAKKGGFSEGVFVETIELSDDDEWVAYYRQEPDKYPET